ncbi:unnamed protein product, partial [Prorocentrum cordatum]
PKDGDGKDGDGSQQHAMAKTDSGRCWAGGPRSKWTTSAAMPTTSPAQSGRGPHRFRPHFGPPRTEEMRKRSAEHATQRAQPSAHRVRALKPLGASSCTFLAAAGAQLPQPQAAVDLVHKKGRRRDSLEFQKVILRPVSVAPRHPTPRLL